MKIEDIQKDSLISGIEQSGPVRIVAVDSAGENAVSVVYKNQSGTLGERMLFRNDEDLLTRYRPIHQRQKTPAMLKSNFVRLLENALHGVGECLRN